MKALLITLFCFHFILGCGPSSCPPEEVAEHIARQLISREYANDMYKIDLVMKKKFLKKIGDEGYCVIEFDFNATLKEYFLRYEELEKQRTIKGLQIAYIHRDEGWYGAIIQKSR